MHSAEQNLTKPRVATRASNSRPSAADIRKLASAILPGFTSLRTAFTAAITVARLAGAPASAFSTADACSARHLCSVPARAHLDLSLA